MPDPVTPSGVQERCPECGGPKEYPRSQQFSSAPGGVLCRNPFHSPSPEPKTAEPKSWTLEGRADGRTDYIAVFGPHLHPGERVIVVERKEGS